MNQKTEKKTLNKEHRQAKRLTWKQICQQYPDEFVVLANPIFKGLDVQSGIVVSHSKNPKNLKIPFSEDYESFTERWTGKLPNDFKFPDITSVR
jgi:hypothetical protein